METGERKLKVEMRRLRQQIARASNEIYQRTQKRKATAKKKVVSNELKKLIWMGISNDMDVKTV